MKKIFFTLSAIATISTVYFGCSKDIHERTADLPALSPSNIYSNAVAWKLGII